MKGLNLTKLGHRLDIRGEGDVRHGFQIPGWLRWMSEE